MKLHHILALGLAILVLQTACGKKESGTVPEKTAAGGKVEWLTDFDAAKAEARAQNKTLLIDFTGSDWCPPCIALEKIVFSQPGFAEYAAKNLVLLEVDFPRRKEQTAAQKEANQKLAGQFGVEGFPTVILLDPNGKVVGKLGYYQDTTLQSFLTEIDKARSARGSDGS